MKDPFRPQFSADDLKVAFAHALSPTTPYIPVAASDELITGYRAWKVFDGKRVALLGSLYSFAIWPPGEPLEADELYQRDDPPVGLTNSYVERTGVHAFADLPAAWRYKSSYEDTLRSALPPNLKRPTLNCNVVAFGSVAMWGRVIEHERGYRAQYAYPLHVYCPTVDMAQAVARTYGCEAEGVNVSEWLWR